MIRKSFFHPASSYNKSLLHKTAPFFKKNIEELTSDVSLISLSENTPFISAKKRVNNPYIILGGHFDTVLEGKITEDENCFYGPGVADMQGGIWVLLESLKEFEKKQPTLGWKLFLNADEEIGSPFSKEPIIDFASGAQAAFLFEPARKDGKLVSSRGSSLNIEVVVDGETGHAGISPTKASAVAALLEVCSSLEKDFHQKEGSLVNIGQIKGGEAFNQIAATAEASVNFRNTRIDGNKKFIEELSSRLSNLDKERGTNSRFKVISERPVKPWNEMDRLLAQQYLYDSSLDIDHYFEPSKGVSDGNLIAALGIPTLDTLGVVGGGFHTSKEWANKASFLEKKRLFVQFLNRLETSFKKFGSIFIEK